MVFYPNFYVHDGKKYFTVESIKNDQYVYMNGNQIFHQDLLIDFDHHLIQNKVSFEGYTRAYNDKIQTIALRKRKKLTHPTEDQEDP